MIVFDSDAAAKLATMLEKIKSQSLHARCIFFNLKDNQPSASVISDSCLALASEYLSPTLTQIFCCDDGDIFIIAPTIPAKNGKEFIQAVAEKSALQVQDNWVRFLELPLHIGLLLYEVSAKLDKLESIKQDKQQQATNQLQQSKRQSILAPLLPQNSEAIKSRRSKRAQPELMIIEDDAFSRRLVENVVQKQFSLTALGEANSALFTYARIAPNLLFLDIDLPDVTGHELLERIMEIDPEAYVIMLSGNSDKHNITQAMSKGAKGFIAKPFTRDKLFRYIELCPTIHT